MTKPRVAVLGIGLMGAPMSRNLLHAGYSVTVWNRTRAKAEALIGDGATVATSPAAAVQQADVVILMLENGPVTETVLFQQGTAAALKPGSVVIDMASIPPSAARRHATQLATDGVAHLDAPVSGGTRGAAEGTLAIMVGGQAAVFEQWQSLFIPLGRATYVGPDGAGQLAKLANQAIVGITIGAVAEALLLAAAGGADPAAVRRALMGGFADSRILSEHGKRMLERNFLPGGRVQIQVKDLDTILAEAAALGLDLPIARRVTELFTALRDNGGADYDHSALLLQLERLNAPARLSTKADQVPS